MQGKDRATNIARVLEIDTGRYGAFPLGEREILHAGISECLQALKWLK